VKPALDARGRLAVLQQQNRQTTVSDKGKAYTNNGKAYQWRFTSSVVEPAFRTTATAAQVSSMHAALCPGMNATSPQMKGAEVAPFTAAAAAAASPSSTAPAHDLAVVDCDSVTALQAVGNVQPQARSSQQAQGKSQQKLVEQLVWTANAPTHSLQVATVGAILHYKGCTLGHCPAGLGNGIHTSTLLAVD
jgi:hypothetical protein